MTTLNESIKFIRQYVGKEVTARKEGTVESLRVIGYSVSKMEDASVLLAILEDGGKGWPVTESMTNRKPGDKVYSRFIDKGLTARFESLFHIDEFKDLIATEYIK